MVVKLLTRIHTLNRFLVAVPVEDEDVDEWIVLHDVGASSRFVLEPIGAVKSFGIRGGVQTVRLLLGFNTNKEGHKKV